MARHQQRIDEIVGNKEAVPDHSLRAKALKRALDNKVPTTLTPWEWQQWYEENGMPEGHRIEPQTQPKPWWRRWL